MVSVADCVRVADGRDGDRRQDRATLLGKPDPQPTTAGLRPWAKLIVELGGSVRLQASGDRVERDVPYAVTGGGSTNVLRVEDMEARALRATAEDPAEQ